MEKKSNEGIPCTYCSQDALAGTNPPVCEDHLTTKTASEEPKTLKELSQKDD